MVGNESYKPYGDAHEDIGQNLSDINKINSLKLQEKQEIVPHYTRDESPPGERVKFEGLEDKDSICSEEDEDKLPPIPDGGWGWVVVFAAFLTSACADGLAYSFGILHEEFTNYFNESQSKTSLIGSLFISIPLISGPVMSALVDRYGCRYMTMIAALLSTIGFLLAAISNSVEMLCLTLGVISGLAMGIFYVTSVVSVAFWFDKRRTLAVSIASCGIGFGTLMYSPLTDLLIRLYDWRNTIVLLAGTVLNVCVCGALMRDPDWVIIKEQRERKEAKARSRKSSSAGSISLRSTGGESVFLTADELNDVLKSGQSPEYILEMLTTTLAAAEQLEATTQMNVEQSYKRVHSDIHLPTFIQKREQVPAEVIEKLMTNKRLYNIILQNYPDLLTRRRSEVNLNVEPSIANTLTEPTTMKLTVMAKKPKAVTETETHKSKAEAKKEAPFEATLNVENNTDTKNETKIKKDETAANNHFKLENKAESKNEVKNNVKIDTKTEAKVKQDKTVVNDQLKLENKVDPKVAARTDVKIETKVKQEKAVTNNQLKPIQQPGWLTRQINTDHHYLRDMALYKNTIMYRGAMMNIPRYKLRASSLPDIYRNSTWSIWSGSDDNKKWYDKVIDGFKSTFDFKMFTEFHFLIFNLASLILAVWAIIPYFFLKSYMTTVNIEGGATMIGIVGIASGIGIVALGWAGDQPWFNVTKAFAICLFICGISIAVYPLFITNYWALAVNSTIFGLSYASSYSYTPAILIKLVPIDYFTLGYGLILLSQGIGHLIGPPLGGLLFDLTKSWDMTFYVGGVWVIFAGVCVGVIPYTENMRLCGSAPLLNEADEAQSKDSINV